MKLDFIMKKKYQVFLSSTYIDLIEARNKVINALLEMDFIPTGMELFPADDDEQWQHIKRVVDECDYYVVIIAGRYGSIGPDGKSYTQMEYEYAQSKGKPTIAFLHEKPDTLPGHFTEQTEIGRAGLDSFRKICQKKLVKYWSTPEQLAGLVYTSLSKLVLNKPGIGWIRADMLYHEIIPKAQDFFYTLDDKRNSSFPELSKGAKSISILARTAVNILSQYQRTFEDLLRDSCKIRLMSICPESEAAKYVYGSNQELFVENCRAMDYHIDQLKNKFPFGLEVRCIAHAPSTSLIIIEKENPNQNHIIVQLYFLHSRISRDRPLFRVDSNDKWFHAFNDEFTELWKNARVII